MADTAKKAALLAILGPMKAEKKEKPAESESDVGEEAEAIAGEEALVAIENKDSAGFTRALKALVRACMAKGYDDEEEDDS